MTRTFKCNIFFLSDSTTRPSDLSLYVIVESGNSCSVSLKSCFKWPHPFWGDLGRNENRPRPLPLTPMLHPFFFHKTELSMHSLWLPGGLAPPGLVISSGSKSLYERHTARQRHILSRWLLFSAITRFAPRQKPFFVRLSNEEHSTQNT